MSATEATAIQSKTSTPMRRTSWKDSSDPYTSVPENEKSLPPITTSNPFDSPLSIGHIIPINPAQSTTDIEAQYTTSIKPRLKHKALACTTLTCMIVVWLFLVAGILVLTDNVPNLAREYHALKDMEIHMIDTKAAVDVVKGQVGKLYGYMEGFGFANGFGFRGWGGENGTEVVGGYENM